MRTEKKREGRLKGEMGGGEPFANKLSFHHSYCSVCLLGTIHFDKEWEILHVPETIENLCLIFFSSAFVLEQNKKFSVGSFPFVATWLLPKSFHPLLPLLSLFLLQFVNANLTYACIHETPLTSVPFVMKITASRDLMGKVNRVLFLW